MWSNQLSQNTKSHKPLRIKGLQLFEIDLQLYLHDDRKDHWAAAGAFIEKFAK